MPPLLILKFLHRYFPSCKCPVSSVFWACFWHTSVVDCVCKHVHTKLLQPISLAAAKAFVLFALGTWAYAGSSPVTTDDTSCFDSSWLSINTSSRSTCSAKLPCIIPEKPWQSPWLLTWCRGRGRMYETNWIFEQTSPSSLLPQSSVQKRRKYFRELTVLFCRDFNVLNWVYNDVKKKLTTFSASAWVTYSSSSIILVMSKQMLSQTKSSICWLLVSQWPPAWIFCNRNYFYLHISVALNKWAIGIMNIVMNVRLTNMFVYCTASQKKPSIMADNE